MVSARARYASVRSTGRERARADALGELANGGEEDVGGDRGGGGGGHQRRLRGARKMWAGSSEGSRGKARRRSSWAWASWERRVRSARSAGDQASAVAGEDGLDAGVGFGEGRGRQGWCGRWRRWRWRWRGGFRFVVGDGAGGADGEQGGAGGEAEGAGEGATGEARHAGMIAGGFGAGNPEQCSTPIVGGGAATLP